MRKNYIIISLILILSILLTTNVFADMGPKPTADFYVTFDGEEVNDFFYSNMLTCSYDMDYEELVEELSQYEDINRTAWYEKCYEIAPDYGFEIDDCKYGNIRSQTAWLNDSLYEDCKIMATQNYKENGTYVREINETKQKICEKLIFKIPDDGCYWVDAPLAWGGECENSTCHFFYFLPDEFKLAIYIPSQDQVYISNLVTRTAFYSTFDVNIVSDGTMGVTETSVFTNPPYVYENWKYITYEFIIALLITLSIELGIIFLYLRFVKKKKKKKYRLLLYALIANLITIPIVWLLFINGNIFNSFIMAFIFAEIFAIVFESFFIYHFNKKLVSLKESFVLCTVTNAISFILGTFLTVIGSWLLLDLLHYL